MRFMLTKISVGPALGRAWYSMPSRSCASTTPSPLRQSTMRGATRRLRSGAKPVLLRGWYTLTGPCRMFGCGEPGDLNENYQLHQSRSGSFIETHHQRIEKLD